MTKPKKCSACGERVRGHDGPTGAKCKYHDSPPPIPGSPIPGSPTPGSPDTGPPDHTLLLVIELSKTVSPTTTMEFLGIELDTIKMELRISDVRLCEIMTELQCWKHRTVCKKCELLSIIGKLIFISRVVRAGRTFVRRMIDLAKTVKHLHYRVKLNAVMKADIEWWITYLPTWNGVSFMYDMNWSNSYDLQLWTDASDIAIGGYFNGSWFMQTLTASARSFPIAWRELLAVVVALSTWGHRLQGKRVRFYIDNSAIVQVINKGCSRNSDLMTLVRWLFFIAAGHGFEFHAEYLPSTDNAIADALSRADLSRFRRLAPNAETLPSITGFVPLIM